jgi:RNA-directed DNA polymerase
MDSIERFLDKRLRLKVNRQKSAVAKPQDRQFLGFSFTSARWLKIKPSPKALKSVKHRIRKITRRSRGISLLQVIKELNAYIGGWFGYYKLVETPTTFRDLDSWIRRRLRCFIIKQWINNSHTRYKNLTAMGVGKKLACGVAASRKGPWALSNSKPLKVATPNRFFAKMGLICLQNRYEHLAKIM